MSTDRRVVRLFLCGDVMLGRGIDQILPCPSKPRLYESYVRDARAYVELAEDGGAVLPKPADPAYVWGEALDELDRQAPQLRQINLETAVTLSDTPWPGKGIHYRMHPRNVDVLTVAGIDCCTLANNHVLDWGHEGLEETLQTLESAGIEVAGAGLDLEAAQRPAQFQRAGGRLLILGCGAADSGIPRDWAASAGRSGGHWLPDLSVAQAHRIGERAAADKRAGDVLVVSIHWGGNWGYEIPAEQRAFAHALIDAGVDLVHGHSSHHPRPFEIYRGRLILYGCGDFINDYEGIRGYETFRADLALMYFADISLEDGRLQALRMPVMQIHGFRLHRAARRDCEWLRQVLVQTGRAVGTEIELAADDALEAFS